MKIKMLELLIMMILLGNVKESEYAPAGRIQGVVVNGTRGNEPLADVAVVLRAGPDGMLTAIAETTTDMYGKFVFDDLPLDASTIYLPGADFDGVHYPGVRVRLDSGSRFAHVRIMAFEAVDSPSPLLAEQHEIDIKFLHGVVEISETLVISNPSRTTYVGLKVDEKRPVTLKLSVPPHFDRVTFASEFYGRRFYIVDHQPVTDIPWPPGNRKLKFSYQIPLEKTGGLLRRTLDLPCGHAALRVRGENLKAVSCSLPPANGDRDGIKFASAGSQLAAGDVIELQIGTAPFPWMEVGRWGSVIGLAGVALATAAVLRRRDSASRRL